MDIPKTNRDVVATGTNADNNFYRNNSGGRARSLHLTSVENPFTEQAAVEKTATQRKQERTRKQEQLSGLEIIFSNAKIETLLS